MQYFTNKKKKKKNSPPPINADAIMMTLCELSTAHIHIPIECEALHKDIDNINDVITNCAQ